MKIKYQIFVSSTYEDLKEVREQIIRCVLEMGHIPVGMEMFSAANEDQWKVIQKQIDDCDYYMVIVAHRYGSLDKDISFTEKEYDYAISKNIPVLGFIIDDNTKWSAKYIDTDELTKQRLIKFKEKIKTKMVNFWKNTDDIYGKTAIALGKAFVTYERPGYIRSDEVANQDVFNELTRLSTENSNLRTQISDIKKTIKEDTENQEKDLLLILESTKYRIPIKFIDETEWDKSHTLSLLEIFETISERILIEEEELNLKKAIALKATGRINYNPEIPVAFNRFAQWMADLSALDLIAPSTKKHSLNDTSKYWTLTDLGREVFSKLRKLKLMAGIPTFKESDDQGDTNSDSTSLENLSN